MTSKEIREEFLRFFESKGHLKLASASLIPDDPTVLLTIAGMVPFKKYFLGETPPARRITTVQKCIRTPDIERVGYTRRHLTFFEMLGNFSFGDYFKREAITWSWEFLTERLKLQKEKLWITVYKNDEESRDIWEREIGIPAERIVPMGEDDNFWTMGPVGPCGPCSEVIFDLGPEFGCGKPDCKVGCDCDRYLEVWNLVFTEFDRDKDGHLTPLPRKNIDTGMGLERAAFVIQGVNSVFETDLFRPIMDYIGEITERQYSESRDITYNFNVIADHARAITFLIGDGVIPGNEGRGYVLRRIIRRAVRYGVKLGLNSPFLHKIVPLVVFIMKDAYPELERESEFITGITKREEENFLSTLERGLDRVEDIIKQEGYISGEEAFRLYDTYGFPLELTLEIAREKNIGVDIKGFKEIMEESRERTRAGRKKVFLTTLKEDLTSNFIGYDTLEGEGEVLYLTRNNNPVEELGKGERGELVTDVTPFYPESGGQLSDRGIIFSNGTKISVLDVQKKGNAIYHTVEVMEGKVSIGDKVYLKVDGSRRKALARAHTATHILHSVLREKLGDIVKQAGSLVDTDHLRFDFVCFDDIDPTTRDSIEQEINKHIREDLSVKIESLPLETAIKEGAIALFGEKYGDMVRVVGIDSLSKELCGGTHLRGTGEVGAFVIREIYSVGTGVKRVEALVGEKAIEFVQNERALIEEISDILKSNPQEIIPSIKKREEELESLRKDNQKIQQILAKLLAERIIDNRITLDGIDIVGFLLEDFSIDFLRLIGDRIKEYLPSSIIFLGSKNKDGLRFVIMASKSAVEKGIKAGELMREISKLFSGSGGGREELAQGGGKLIVPFEDGISKLKELVEKKLKN
ncbi:MAG TPA: alanine--tRNA ligase [bacterium]|nr:alanine--tRNA ligase [bacterium]